jgi:hypothetical protein
LGEKNRGRKVPLVVPLTPPASVKFSVDDIAKLSNSEFVELFKDVSPKEIEATMERLTDEEKVPFNAKYKALIDHRSKKTRNKEASHV